MTVYLFEKREDARKWAKELVANTPFKYKTVKVKIEVPMKAYAAGTKIFTTSGFWIPYYGSPLNQTYYTVILGRGKKWDDDWLKEVGLKLVRRKKE